ncbi:unnamed protein product [Bemisia tabaci]|uniref:Uncharacterized protein n=1 Tax=Bemisia tabaci TaxID=7038 RepID=A0A9P0A9N0_BEMTA|nr:unnamed protein product [Bemisia tabaci]
MRNSKMDAEFKMTDAELRAHFVNAVDADQCRRRYADAIMRSLAENQCQHILAQWMNLPRDDKKHCQIAENARCKLKLAYCGLWWTTRCSFQCSSINRPTATKRVFAASLARPFRVSLPRIYPRF